MRNKLEDFVIQKHFSQQIWVLRKAQIHFKLSGGTKLVNLSLRNTKQAIKIQLKELTESI